MTNATVKMFVVVVVVVVVATIIMFIVCTLTALVSVRVRGVFIGL